MGFELRVIFLGYDVIFVIYVVFVVVRVVLIFGGLIFGDLNGLLEYIVNRVFVFVNVFGLLSELVVFVGVGVIVLGFLVIID